MDTITATYTLTTREESTTGFALKFKPAANSPLTRLWQSNAASTLEVALANAATTQAVPIGSTLQIVLTITPPTGQGA